MHQSSRAQVRFGDQFRIGVRSTQGFAHNEHMLFRLGWVVQANYYWQIMNGLWTDFSRIFHDLFTDYLRSRSQSRLNPLPTIIMVSINPLPTVVIVGIDPYSRSNPLSKKRRPNSTVTLPLTLTVITLPWILITLSRTLYLYRRPTQTKESFDHTSRITVAIRMRTPLRTPNLTLKHTC